MSLKETLNDYEIQLDDNQIDLLLKYMNLVLEKNKVMNLTAITEEEMFHVKHPPWSLGLCHTAILIPL